MVVQIGAALVAVVGLGAVGGIIANIALTPLTAGAALLQSYWYGAGLILGERMMYTVHWEKIKARLDKGETFMNVLDQEMNKDITAIAELSFKAMDDTGKLFLEQGTANLGKFIEELLASAINPFFSGDRPTGEEEPTAEEPPGTDIIHYNIDKINSLDLHQINQILAFPERYTETTVAHAKIRKVQLLLDEDTGTEETTTTFNIRNEIFKEQQQYLIWLTTLDLIAIKGGAFSGDADLQRKLEINYGADFITRTRSSASDQRLQEWRDNLLNFQNILLNKIAGGTQGDGNIRDVNVAHTMIWVHQLIYSK